jgi:hypothetical protein
VVVQRRSFDLKSCAELAHGDGVDPTLVGKVDGRAQNALTIESVPRFLAGCWGSDDDASSVLRSACDCSVLDILTLLVHSPFGHNTNTVSIPTACGI